MNNIGQNRTRNKRSRSSSVLEHKCPCTSSVQSVVVLVPAGLSSGVHPRKGPVFAPEGLHVALDVAGRRAVEMEVAAPTAHHTAAGHVRAVEHLSLHVCARVWEVYVSACLYCVKVTFSAGGREEYITYSQRMHVYATRQL